MTRESSALITSKRGFSVVAPISVTTPSSTAGSSASCCALLKRWISSRKRIVAVWRWRARSITARTSARPASTALCSSKLASVAAAIARASVVLPEPGGPWRIIECSRPGLDRAAQRRLRAEQLALADDLVERARAHARGERRVRAREPALVEQPRVLA